MKNEECRLRLRMKNFIPQEILHSSFFIPHSSFFIKYFTSAVTRDRDDRLRYP